MKREKVNVLITGVGGQGTIVAAQIVGIAATRQGLNTAIGETYGVSQRGGSVMSHVKVARGAVGGPLIPAGGADVIVGFEPSETMRVMADFASPASVVIVSPRPMYSVGVLAGESRYPEVDELLASLRALAQQVFVVGAVELARQAGDPLAQNVVLVGCLDGLGLLPIETVHFRAAIAETFARRRPDINLRAFQLGREAVIGLRG